MGVERYFKKTEEQLQQEVFSSEMLKYAVKILYTTGCGKITQHTIIPLDIYRGITECSIKEQWLLRVWDVESKMESIYALKDIKKWLTTPDEEEETF